LNRSLLIVLHGKQAGNAAVRKAVAAVRDSGHRVEVRVTWESGDVARLVREAIAMSVDTVVAGGGDGTINEVTQALIASDSAANPSLGILPLGTANDFARSTGIRLEPEPALRLIVDSAAVSIDVGRIGARCFLNVATGGFGTKITVGTPAELKRLLGGTAYLLTGLKRFNSIHSSPGRITAPGFEWSGSFLVLAVGNGRQAGGGHVLCPHAKLNDGLLDVGILPEVERSELPNVLNQLLHDGFSAVEQVAVRARVPWLELRSEAELHLNLDGEPITSKHFRIEVQRGAVRAHLPPSEML
jgi:lipid kinase YegS